MVRQQFEKIVRSDNGTEFWCLKEYFAKHEILHQTSYVGTPNKMDV